MMRLKDYPLGPLLSLALMSLGAGYIVTHISLFLAETQHSAFMIGVIHSAFQLGLIIGSIYLERILAPIGYVRTFTLLTTINTLTVLCQALSDSMTVWILLRFLSGFCIAGLYVVIEGWLLGISAPHTRGKMLSIYLIFLYGAQTISQVFVYFIDSLSLTPFILSGLLSTLSIIPILLTQIKAPETYPTSASLKQFKTLTKQAPVGAFACFISGIILSAIYTFGPIFAYQLSLSVFLVMGALLGGGMILQIPIGKISDQMNRQQLLLLLGILLAIPSCLLATTLNIPIVFFLFCFLIGGISFGLYPVGIACFVDRIPKHNVLSAAAIALLAYSLGAVIGPLLSAVLFEIGKPFVLFHLIALSGLLLAVASRRSKNDIATLDK